MPCIYCIMCYNAFFIMVMYLYLSNKKPPILNIDGLIIHLQALKIINTGNNKIINIYNLRSPPNTFLFFRKTIFQNYKIYPH